MIDYTSGIPSSLAGAYNWLSHDPEGRFRRSRLEYAQILTQDLEQFTRAAETSGTPALVEAEFARYRDGLRKRWTAAIASDSRCASSFITGGSNFPAARMQKRNDVAGKRWNEVFGYRERAIAAIMRELQPQFRPIMAGDSDATSRLAEEIAAAEADQVRMLAINAAHKRYLKDPATLESSSLSEVEQRIVRDYRPEYSWEPRPYAPYTLSNNTANIRRMKQRLAKIEVAQATPETVHEGVNARLEDSPSDNRVRLFFPGKPADDVRAKLKRNGFRWTPTLGCWQAYRNTRSIQFAAALAGVDGDAQSSR